MKHSFSVVLIFMFALSSCLFAARKSFYGAAAYDGSINSASADAKDYSSNVLYVTYTKKAMMYWDSSTVWNISSGIPSNAVINSCSIYVDVISVNDDAFGNCVINFHFQEKPYIGTTDGSTWNKWKDPAGTSDDSSWGTAGCANGDATSNSTGNFNRSTATGVDYKSTAFGSYTGDHETPEANVAIVADTNWLRLFRYGQLGCANAKYGVLVIGSSFASGDSVTLCSYEGMLAEVGTSPRLVINYTLYNRLKVNVSSDNYVYGSSSTYNWGGATTLKVDEGSSAADYRTILSFNKSAFSDALSNSDLAVVSVSSCSLQIPVTTVTTAGDCYIYGMWKPAFCGNNNGTAADGGEMEWTSWYEGGVGTDSTFGTAGIATASDAGAWNRTIGGNDRKTTAEATLTVSTTGTKYISLTTAFTQTALREMSTDAYRQLNFVLYSSSNSGLNMVLNALEATSGDKPAIILNYSTVSGAYARRRRELVAEDSRKENYICYEYQREDILR